MSLPNAALRIAVPAPDSNPDGAEVRSGAMIPEVARGEPTTQVHRTAELVTRAPASRAAVVAIEVIEGPDHDLVVDRSARAAANGKRRYVREAPIARIRQRGRSPMQSGRARESVWLLTFEPQYRAEIDFLMGWTGSRDTLQQVELQFTTLDEAVAFAKRRGLGYEAEAPRRREVRPKSYADNFRHDQFLPWTH